MSVVVGTLVVDLQAKTASFSQSMDKMSHLSAKSANDIKRSLEKIALAGTAMAAAIAGGTSAMIMHALDAADSLGKLSQAAGLSAESLSTLNYAAGLSDVATEDLGKGLEKLAKSAFAVNNGNKDLAVVFKRLGVSVVDSNGHLKDTGTLFGEISTKFASIEDGTGKTALATEIFGKAGAKLIPLLNQWGSEQDKVTEEARKFGLVLGTNAAQVAGEAHDNLDRLHAVFEGIGMSLLQATLPALKDLSQQLITVATKANIPQLAQSFGAHVSDAVKNFGGAMEWATEHAKALKYALGALVAIQLGKFAIPVIADLTNGGAEKLGSGVAKLALNLLGLNRCIPALTQLAKWLQVNTFMVKALAAEEGIASAATYGLTTAFTALTVPAILTGIGALIADIAMLAKATNEARDAGVGYLDIAKGMAAAALTGNAAYGGEVGANSAMQHILPAAKPRALQAPGVPTGIAGGLDDKTYKPIKKDAFDFSGFGKQEFKSDPKAEALANLAQELNESRQLLAVAGLEVEAQRKARAAAEAEKEIVKLGQQLAKERKINTSDFASQVDAETKAIIRRSKAEMAENDARAELIQTIAQSSRGAAQSISQSDLMVEASGKGADAVERQTALTAAWNELREKGANLPQILARSEQIYADNMARSRVNLAGEVRDLQLQVGSRQGLALAMLAGNDAYEQASQASKLYALNAQIAATEDEKAKNLLTQKRDALMALDQIERDEAIARDAVRLKSPLWMYKQETDAIRDATEMLKREAGGHLDRGTALEVAAAQQEAFNKATAETVDLLLRQGSAADGVNAFFLDMQTSAESAARQIYTAMHTAFEGISQNLAALVTGGRTNFAEMLQGMSQQLAQSVIKGQLQEGLGALGKKMNINLGGLGGKRDGSTAQSALFVQMVGAPALAGVGGSTLGGLNWPLGGGGESPLSGDAKGADAAKFGIGSLVKKATSIFGWLGGLIPHASGGTVSPSDAYLVGERGPEILTGVSGRIHSNVESRRMVGNAGSTAYYSIDASGANAADVEMRVQRALREVHTSAIRNSVSAVQEMRARQPRSRW